MSLTAAAVFIALYRIKAGYGMLRDGKWGPCIGNRIGWMLMEAPVFLVMCAFWLGSARRWEPVPLVFFALFQLHYLNRAFVYPLLLRGKSKMPLGIIVMGTVFNVLNACMQGGWIFYLAPEGRYSLPWLWSPQFIAGTLLFFAGMGINLHSDRIVRNLRKPGDTRHYLPKGGLFDYVTSANYFGEIVEWAGFAVLTWSWAGAVFALWTFANLVPRADALHRRYREEFGPEFGKRPLKRVIPFIY